MRDIHKVGWTLVPLLRLSFEDKAAQLEVQGEAESTDKEARAQGSQAHNCSRKID